MDYFSDDELKKKFLKSVNYLLKNDIFLLENNVSERAITHKLAEYLQKEFPEWHVDCEYNRDIDNVKRRPESSALNPDVVVHIRNTKNNLLIIEAKKSNGEDNDEENRLKEATSVQHQYNYQLGIFITFNVLADFRKEPFIEFFKNGSKIRSRR